MGDVVSAASRTALVSISRVSDELGLARETVARRIADLAIQPAGERQGYPVYRWRDVVLLREAEGSARASDILALQRAEESRVATAIKQRQLDLLERRSVDAGEVEQVMAAVVSAVVQTYMTLPDRMEKKAGLLPEHVDRLSSMLDEDREALYATLRSEVERMKRDSSSDD